MTAKDLPYVILVALFGAIVFWAGRMSVQPVVIQAPVVTAPQAIPSAPIIVIASTSAQPVEAPVVTPAPIPSAPVSVAAPKAVPAPKVVKEIKAPTPTYPKPEVIELEETPSSNNPGF